MKTLCLLFVLLAAPASAQFANLPEQDDAIMRVSEYVLMVGHAMDLASTQRCLGAGRCHEVNPFLLRFDSPVGFTAAKFGVVGLQLWLVRKVHASGHRKLASLVNVGVGGAFAALAVRNERIGK